MRRAQKWADWGPTITRPRRSLVQSGLKPNLHIQRIVRGALEMFGALRCSVDEEDRDGGGDNIDHSDQRLLRNAGGPSPSEGQQHRCDHRERERISVGGLALSRMT